MSKMSEQAYNVIETVQPSLLVEIRRLLALGQTTKQIADHIAVQNVFLAALVEMALDYMTKKETP